MLLTKIIGGTRKDATNNFNQLFNSELIVLN
jgi:hypothetical protein